jgi:hypothetical protein
LNLRKKILGKREKGRERKTKRKRGREKARKVTESAETGSWKQRFGEKRRHRGAQS